MKVFAKFDEIPSMTLQDIKETKRYGHTFVRSDRRTDNVKTVYPPTNTVCGGYKYQTSILSDSLRCRWLLGAVAPRTPYINVNFFQFYYISFQKKKNEAIFLKNKHQASILSDSLRYRWLLGAVAPKTPYINVNFFQFYYISFQKKKNEAIFLKNKHQASILSDSLRYRWLLGAVAPKTPYINVNFFQFYYISFQKKKNEAIFLKNKYQASILSDSLRCRWLLGATAPRPPYKIVIVSNFTT